jgi:hypothetical protein
MPVDPSVAGEQYERFIYMRDNGHNDFLAKADRCDQFTMGNQWLAEDKARLSAERRPALTINKILSTVETILGEQIQNRTEVLFRPQNGAPSEVADALSKVWMQISQNNQLPWVRSDVFCDGIVRSRGFYDVRLDFSDSLRGEVRIELLNSKNVLIDPDAEEYDPDQWADVIVTKWLNEQDIALLFSEEDAEILKHRGTADYGYDSIEMMRTGFFGRSPVQSWDGSRTGAEVQRRIRVLERQYRKMDKQLHFVDLSTGDMRPVPAGWDRDRIALMLEKTGGRISTTKHLVKRIRWTVTADAVVLHDAWSPFEHFSVVPFFPFFRYGLTTGIVENLLSPQEMLNKTTSQELHVVNTTANSGWIVEQDSLVNMTMPELEAHGAATGIVLEYKRDTQPPAKISPNQIPTGLDRLSYKAEEYIKTISNVSDSMQGFDREDVAAKAIAYKQMRGSVNLSKVLDNLERTDYLLARNVLALIQNYYTEERIVDITHDNILQAPESLVVNAVDPVTGTIANDLTLGEYDIVITSSPYRASLEDSQFEQARALRELPSPVPIPDAVLIENSRLLRRGEIVKEIEAAKTSPEAQEAAELDMRARRAAVAKDEAEVLRIQADAAKRGVDALGKAVEVASGGDLAKMQAELALERERLDMELEKMREEMALKLREMELKAQAQQQEAAQRMEQKEIQFRQDMRIRQQRADREADTQRAAALRGESAPAETRSYEGEE